MSTQVNVNAIEPEGGTTTLTVGQTGQNTVISADAVKVNTFKDSGGNTLFTSNGSGVLSSVNSGFGSSQVLISSQTADDAASLSFTSGIDSTYDEYIFEFYTVRGSIDQKDLGFQVNASGETGYNETITSTFFYAEHSESGSGGALSYSAGQDQAQGTGFQSVGAGVGSSADECLAGELHIFNPSSTTYVKNFYGVTQFYHGSNYSQQDFSAGYINITSAITQVQFKFHDGNIADGTFKLWGVK